MKVVLLLAIGALAASSAPTWTKTLTQLSSTVSYESLGAGFCSDWEYLPEGGYPAFLTSGSAMDSSDRIQECANRCTAAAGSPGSSKRGNIGTQAFYIRTSDNKCGCSQGACSSHSGSGYHSYRIKQTADQADDIGGHTTTSCHCNGCSADKHTVNAAENASDCARACHADSNCKISLFDSERNVPPMGVKCFLYNADPT